MQDDKTELEPVQLRELLKLAEDVAREAGKRLLKAAADGRWSGIAEESRRDIKLEADSMSEKYIVERLVAGSPYGILGEESGQQGPMFDSGTDFFWVVDPLDGTVNYFQGIPLYCCSIALMKGGQAVLGVIYDFENDEMFTALVGQGSFLNGDEIRVSEKVQKDQSVLMTGLPAGRNFSDQAMADFGKELGRWRKVRMIGSAALSTAYIACGRADAYWEQGILLWDIAAGLALIEAAGGKINIKPTSFSENHSDPLARWRVNVIATNGRSRDIETIGEA